MSRICLNCTKPFTPDDSVLRRKNLRSKNEGKFCSQICGSRYNAKTKPKLEPNVTCAYCKVAFYKNKSKQVKSKSGLFFCCREHKDLAQRIENGFTEIMPPHFKNGKKNYRDKAFRNFPKVCSQCGYNKYVGVLIVHHIDCNRGNNDLSNLKILCPNCHEEEHFLTKTGRWGPK